MQNRAAKLKLETPNSILIIGFDAEWVTEAADPPEDDDGVEDGDPNDAAYERLLPNKIPRNRVLSYQYACRYQGRDWTDIVYPRAGARIRHPDMSELEIAKLPERIDFAALLAFAIQHSIHDKHLTRWPKRLIPAAHWTRADLSAMADFAVIKRLFDGVQKTYATVGELCQAQVNVSGHMRELHVLLIDTQLLVPGSSKSLAALGDLYSFQKLDPGYRFMGRADGTIERFPTSSAWTGCLATIRSFTSNMRSATPRSVPATSMNCCISPMTSLA